MYKDEAYIKYYFKSGNRLYPYIITVLIMVYLLSTIHAYAQPKWARPGIYVEYSMKIVVFKTNVVSMIPGLSEKLNDYI